jgi:hypothetical protein
MLLRQKPNGTNSNHPSLIYNFSVLPIKPNWRDNLLRQYPTSPALRLMTYFSIFVSHFELNFKLSPFPKNLFSCDSAKRPNPSFNRTQQPVSDSSFNRFAFSAPSSLRLAVGPVNNIR